MAWLLSSPWLVGMLTGGITNGIDLDFVSSWEIPSFFHFQATSGIWPLLCLLLRPPASSSLRICSNDASQILWTSSIQVKRLIPFELDLHDWSIIVCQCWSSRTCWVSYCRPETGNIVRRMSPILLRPSGVLQPAESSLWRSVPPRGCPGPEHDSQSELQKFPVPEPIISAPTDGGRHPSCG